MQIREEEAASEWSNRTLRLLPWVYSSVVVGSLVAGCMVQGAGESFVCGLAVMALLAGFVAVASRIGLWGRHDRESETSLSGSLCGSSG